MEEGDRVSIIRIGRRRKLRRWGTAIVVRAGAQGVQARFDGGEPFFAYHWSSTLPPLPESMESPIVFARSLPTAAEPALGDAGARA